MKFLFLVLAFVAGAATSLQIPVNTELRRQLSHPMQATFVSFAVGMLISLAYCLFSGSSVPSLAVLSRAPWWVWCGGVLGTLYVWSSVVLSPKIGLAAMLSMVIAGQMLMSLAIDHFGHLNAAVYPATPQRVVGAVLVIAGAAVMSFGK